MQRRALIVAGAAGPDEIPAEVLPRFGFGPSTPVTSLDEALTLLRGDHFDLLILPLTELGPLQLTALEREIRKSGILVIGTAPKADSELILRAMRAGIHEFLTFPPDTKELTGAVDRLVRRSSTEAQRGQVFAVYGAKGGLGNTTIAVNLAHALAKNHSEGRIALADLVIAGGDVRVLLDLKPTYDLSSLLEKLDRLDADLLYSLLTLASSGLWVLPGPDNPELDDALDANTTSSIIEHLRAHFAFTVLDCEHHLSERTIAALDAADRILLITQLTVPALRSTQRTLALCRRLGYGDDKLCVVVNRYQSGEALTPRDAEDVFKCDLFWKLPNDYRTAAGAQTRGVAITAFDGDSKLAWSFAQLAGKLGGVPATAGKRNGVHHGSTIGRLFSLGRRK